MGKLIPKIYQKTSYFCHVFNSIVRTNNTPRRPILSLDRITRFILHIFFFFFFFSRCGIVFRGQKTRPPQIGISFPSFLCPFQKKVASRKKEVCAEYVFFLIYSFFSRNLDHAKKSINADICTSSPYLDQGTLFNSNYIHTYTRFSLRKVTHSQILQFHTLIRFFCEWRKPTV